MEQIASIFEPFDTDAITLSPDGNRVAYTRHEGNQLLLVLRDLGPNTVRRIPLAVDRAPELSGQREKTPASVTLLRWATNDRVVFNLNGRNVWSIGADGNKPVLLGDVRLFANEPNLPDPGIGISNTVEAPSALAAMASQNIPIHVITMPRGDRFVYIEAPMQSRGVAHYVETDPETGVAMNRKERTPGGTPRVEFRVDAVNGKAEEWAEVPQAEFMLCDQQGYPRLIYTSDNVDNARSLTRVFKYSGPSTKGKWENLDRLVAGPFANAFVRRPSGILQPHAIPLAFDFDPKVLYFASNVGRDSFGIYALDTTTWQETPLKIETPSLDMVDPGADSGASGALVFDGWQKKLVGIRYTAREPGTRWLDPELVSVQRDLEASDRSRQWEILEWSRDRDAYLVQATSQSEPGVFCVYRPAEHELAELTSRAPRLGVPARNPGSSFAFKTKSGVNLTGYLTLPQSPILKHPPLVVLCHDGPWTRDLPGYDREAQSLAIMGFIVLQVNYRGSAGFGRAYLDALREGPDSVAIDDIMAALDAIVPQDVDRRLIAIMGHGYGGYLALRAVQLHPERFRCAIAWDAPTDLAGWVNRAAGTFAGDERLEFFGSDLARLHAISPVAHPDQVKNPVMIIEGDAVSENGGRAFAHAVERTNPDVVFLPLSANAAAPRPQARAELFGKIHDFLNAYIYNYAVKIGALQVVGDRAPPPLKPAAPVVKPDAPLPRPELPRPDPVPAIRP